MQEERRVIQRRKFGYYMRVLDNSTQQLLGYLSDISSQGLKLDSLKSLPVNKDFGLRLDLTPEISDKPFIMFVARCKWSQPDALDPNAFVQGFEIVSIAPHDAEIYQRIVDVYGKPQSKW